MTIRVVLVDDIPAFRYLVRTALGGRHGFEVVAEAGDGQGAVAAVTAHRPDVVVLDLGLPDLAGQEVLAQIRARAPGTKVVVFTGTDVPGGDSIRSSVEGYVRKDEELDYLVGLLEDLGRSAQQSAAIYLAASPASSSAARRFVEEVLSSWGCSGFEEDARLIASELVSNAVLHAGTACELRLRLTTGALRLEVADRGAGSPDPLVAGEHDEHGRGLLIVSSLSAAWGVGAESGGKVVWAELAPRS